MLAHIRRSWEYARISWAFQRECRPLLVLPVLSGVLVLTVIATFFGFLCPPRLLLAIVGGGNGGGPFDRRPVYIGLLLAFFWCSFAIVFFNAAITAAVMGTGRRRGPTVRACLLTAGKRMPELAAWTVLSLLPGALFKPVEAVHEKGSELVAAFFGSSWSALSAFVAPLMLVDGLGPIKALRQSKRTLNRIRPGGTISTYSMGLLGFAVAAPVILVLLFVGVVAVARSSSTGLVLALSLASATVALAVVATSAADAVLKALLFNDATGHSLPAAIDRSRLLEAFRSTDASRLPLKSGMADGPAAPTRDHQLDVDPLDTDAVHGPNEAPLFMAHVTAGPSA